MSRVKHRSRDIFQIFTVGLLSFCAILISGMLRLLKYILKRKENKEEAKETKHPPITNTGESPVLSPNVEPEQQAATTNVEPEQEPIATKVEPEQQAATTNVEPEQKTIAAKVKAEGDVLATEAIEAYCVKCRQRRSIQGAKKVTTQKGRHAMEGTCPICGTKLFRFIARERKKNSG